MPRLYSPVDSRQACTRRIFWPISQSRRWRHPSGEFAKLFARTLLLLDMLASSVFLETSIPNIPSITILSFHFCLFSKNQLPKSVVREIRTPRSVGAGGGQPPSATRWARRNPRPYRDPSRTVPEVVLTSGLAAIAGRDT